MRVVRTEYLGVTLDGCLSPAGLRDDRRPWTGAQVVQLAGPAARDESDHLRAGDRVVEDSGVDDGGLRAAVLPRGGDDAKPWLRGISAAKVARSVTSRRPLRLG
jgi:hypothetical protein